MDPSGRPPAEGGAAWRRRQRRLRSWYRHEQQTVAAALATFTHHSAPRGQRMARAGGGGGGGPRIQVHGGVPGDASPQAAGAVYFEMDTGEDDGSAPAAGRPAPLLEVLPQGGLGRHGGIGYELVLSTAVPQLGRDIVDNPHVMELIWWEQLWRHGAVRDSEAARRLAVDVPKHKAEYEQPVQVARGSRSSNKVGGRRKRKKRRKKKVPKTSSSTFSRCRVRNQGAVEYAEDGGEDEVTIEYEQRAGVLRIHTTNTYTLHAEPLNSFHCKEVTGYTGPGEAAPGMEEAPKYFEDKVIRVMGEETNLKNGTPALNMYSDCTHMYIPCWPDWGENRRRYVRQLAYAPEWTDLLLTYADGQVCCEEWVQQTLSAKTVKNLNWLLFDVPPDLEFQLRRANAACGR